MQCKWLHLLLIGHMWTTVVCKSYYSILAPGVIKSNRKYTASVTLHEADGPATIRLGISRTPAYYTFQDVSLQPFQTKVIDFDLPKLNKDFKYELIAEGLEGLSFKNKTKLLVEDCRALRVYMQTSKGIYKPEDLVQFRVIILDVHLKPIKLNEPVRVQILDAKDHRVKQYKNIRLVKGIFSGSIQLSEHPNLGYWKILVSISGKYDIKEMKPFKVDKYVLPKFSVHLDTVDDFIHEDQILPITVYGRYVYGRYVEGTVIAEIKIHKHVLETQTKDIQEAKAKFEFNVSNYLTYAEVEPNFDVKVTLVDKYTNVSMSSMKTIRHHNQRYKIVVPIEEIEFRDNRPYLINAKVRYLNDTEVNDRTTPIFMKHGSKVYQSLLDEHGATSFIFDYENDKGNKFFFKKTFLELSNMFYNGHANNDSMCNLKVKTGKITLQQAVHVEVSSTSYIPYLVYALISHGNIIKTHYVPLEADQNSYIIQINPTIEMVPKAVLSVHYIDRGQLNHCDIQISFPNEFENKISVSTPNITVEPGQKVSLNIRAQPQSRVGLLAVDLSAHLLNSNYSFNKQQIIKELIYDQSYTDYSFIGFGKQCGLVTFTNADVVNITPQSFSGIHRYTRTPRSSNGSPNFQPLVRTKFPETWIFKEIDILNENSSLSLNIPDTITTWLVTAISINELSGLGITDESLNITVFRPFFISTNLPYSIKRGETIAIPLTIFNYYEKNLNCQIIMNNTDGEFQFMDEEKNILHLRQAVKNVNVSANSGTSVAFTVKALKLGQLKVRLNASSPLAWDAVEQQLRVEPEGILMKDNQEIYLRLQPEALQKSLFTANIPQDIVSDSEFLRLSIGGDTLLPSLENLNNLIQLPTGCGEQNMIKFAPNILVLDYLKTVGKLQENSDMVAKAVKFIETGYQNELTFRHNTGGYSVFGVEGSESTWLTAYVIRFFIKAVKYVAVEPEVIKSGLDFLASHQQSNGEFLHTGHLFYPAHQNLYGFTAFVLMSFTENKKYRKQYEHIVQRGLQFLSNNVNNTHDPYALSIMAATFQMAQSDMVPLIRNKLLTMQYKEDHHQWWTSADKKQSNDVEITSYALMALLETSATEHFSIFSWLIKQRCENGGFRTTHETVVGLQALIKFNEKYTNLHETVINVTFTAKDAQEVEVKQGILEVTADNYMMLQRLELPHTTRSIEYVAQGQGNSLLQFSYHYYVTEDKPSTDIDIDADTNEGNVPPSNTLQMFNVSSRLAKSFVITTARKQQRSLFKAQSFYIKSMAKMSTASEMLLEVCFKYQPSANLQIQKTNMIILEVYLLSGFVSNPNNIQELLEEELITKVELKNSNTSIIMYFDQLQANDEHCLNVLADKVYEVQLLKPSTIEMYDFYNTNLHDSVCYEIMM